MRLGAIYSLQAVLIAFLVLFLYRTIGGADFIWDDKAFLVSKATIRGAASLGDLLFQPFMVSHDYYRPFVVMSYGFEYQFSGLNPASYHWVNVAIHALNAVLVMVVLNGLCKSAGVNSKYWGGLIGVVYAVHPLTIEATAWVSGRFDLMMTLFLLLCLLVEIYIGQKLVKAILIGIGVFLAAASKETAVGFCLSLPFIHLYRQVLSDGNVSFKYLIAQNWITYIFVFLAGALYLGFRFFSMGYLTSGLIYNDYGTVVQHLLLSAKAYCTYLLMIVAPFGKVSPIHYEPFPISLTDLSAWFCLVTAVTLLAAASVGCFKRTFRLPSLALLGITVTILPALHLFQTPLQDSLVQERYMQFPLAMALVFFVLPLIRSELTDNARKMAAAGFGMFLVASCLTIHVTLPLWRSDLALWTWVTQSEPEVQSAWSNLSAAYFELGNLDEAAKAAHQSLDLNRKDTYSAYALVNLGNVESAKGNLEVAAEYYLEGINRSKQVPGALVNMANTLVRMKEFESAKWYLDVAESVAKDEPFYFFNRGLYSLALGDKSTARFEFDKGLSLIAESKRAAYGAIVDDFLSGKKRIKFYEKPASGGQ